MSAALPTFGSLLGLSGVSSAISGLFGLGSSAMNQKSQREANKANYDIAQMNNQWSEKMMEKQNAMNIDQWNREKQFALEQRDYDSAENQASRFRAAGLNPNMVMSGGNAGSAASIPSGSSVGLPSPSSATMQPVDYSGIAASMETALNTYMAFERNKAEVSNLQANSNYVNAKAQFEAAKAYEETENIQQQREIAQFMKQINYDFVNSQIGLNHASQWANEHLGDLRKLQVEYQRLVNAQVPDKLALELALLGSQLNQSEIAKRIADYERMTGEKLSPFVKKRLLEFDFGVGVDYAKSGKSILSLPNIRKR